MLQTQSGDHSSGQAASRAFRVRQGFPDLLGLGLVVVMLGGMLGVAVVGHQQRAAQQRAALAAAGEVLADSVALALSASHAQDLAHRRTGLAQLSSQHPQFALRWISADGRPLYEASAAPGSDPAVIRRPILHDGVAEGEVEVRVGGRDAAVPLAGLLATGGVAASALAVFLALYRGLRRHFRPVAVIQRSLESYAAGVERELLSLQLSDRFGQVAAGWNQLIHEVTTLRSAAQRSSGAGSEATYRLEARMLRQVLDRLPLGVMRVDGHQNVTYANETAGALLGADGGAVGKPVRELLDEPALDRALGSGKQLPTRGISFDAIKGADGEGAMRVCVAPLDQEGRWPEQVVTVQDISHLYQAERARDNFLYHVTHELRTPLTNIHAYAETLTKPGFDDEQTRKECYNIIISETRRLSRLVEDILSVSQLEVGTARVEMNDLDLERLIRQTVQDHMASAEEKQIGLTLSLPPKAPKFRGDKQRLAVLLNNIIGNAVKYTPAGGRVAVVVETGEQSLRIAVTDTGVGIAEADLPHIFEKFYRASTQEVRDLPGTGLGLAIAREVARVHGGDIAVRSTPGSGSTFTIELPVSLPDA